MILRSSRTLILMLIVALAVSSSATEQDQKKPPLIFGSEINLVAIPVFVTDKDGKTVPGLTAQDFEVEVGGKPTAIQGFLAISGDGAIEAPTTATAGLTLLSSRRQFVLLFDLALSRAINIERSRTAARKFLETQIGPRDLVSVVVATQQGMKVLLGLSPDRVQVIRAIEAVGRGDAAPRPRLSCTVCPSTIRSPRRRRWA